MTILNKIVMKISKQNSYFYPFEKDTADHTLHLLKKKQKKGLELI